MKIFTLILLFLISIPVFPETTEEDDMVHCLQRNGTNTSFGTQTGLVFAEQDWWHKFKTLLAGVEDIPVQLVSVSKFYKNKSEKEKKEVYELIKENCMKIGGKLIEESIHDFTRGPISYGGICIRDKKILEDNSVKYVMVRSKGRAIYGSMKDKIIADVAMKCKNEYQGEIIHEIKEVTDYLDIFQFAGVCKINNETH